MIKNISILTTSLFLLAGCEKYDGKPKVDEQKLEESAEDFAEDVIESLFPNVTIDIKHDDESVQK